MGNTVNRPPAWLATALVMALLSSGEHGQAEEAGRGKVTGETTKPRVAVIGASVSAGFSNLITRTRDQPNATYKLMAVLRKAWPRD